MAGKVFTVAQQKGGAGKTTLAAHLAVAWAQSGRRVAVVDIDPQGSLSRWMAVRRQALFEEGVAAAAELQGFFGPPLPVADKGQAVQDEDAEESAVLAGQVRDLDHVDQLVQLDLCLLVVRVPGLRADQVRQLHPLALERLRHDVGQFDLGPVLTLALVGRFHERVDLQRFGRCHRGHTRGHDREGFQARR